MPIHKKLVGKLKVNAEDLDLLIKYFINMDGRGYASTHIADKTVPFHILIAKRIYGQYDENLQVDHKDRNRLNCRRLNLRLVTSQQNRFNQSIRSDNKCGYRGVYWDNERSRWYSGISFNGQKRYLGRYENILDAAKAYNKAAVELFGEFANLNKVD